MRVSTPLVLRVSWYISGFKHSFCYRRGMFVRRLPHLIGHTVKIHFDFTGPEESIWIIRRYARFYPGYKNVEIADAEFLVDEEARLQGIEWNATSRTLSGWVQGSLISYDEPQSLEDLREVCYHPWERGEFFYRDTGKKVESAPYVYFHSDQKAYVKKLS